MTLKIPPWLFFVLVALGEYLLISYLFDVSQVLSPAKLTYGGGLLGTFGPLVIVAAAATLITGGSPAKEAAAVLSKWRTLSVNAFFWGLTHVVLYACIIFIAHHLATSNTLTRGEARAWLGTLVLLPAIAQVVLALTIWPARDLKRASQLIRGSLKVGLLTGLIAWAAGLSTTYLWKPLTRLTLELVHAQLTVISPDPVASIEHSLVGTSRFYVHVAPVCSGLEGIGLMTAFMSAFLFLSRAHLRWPRAILLLPTSIVGIWVLNSVRLTALIAIGTWGSPQVALGGFHSKAGWVLFTAACLSTIAMVQKSSYFYKVEDVELSDQDAVEIARLAAEKAAPADARGETQGALGSAESAYLLPLLAVLAVSLVSGLMSAGFDHFYPLRVVIASIVLYRYRKTYPTWNFRSPWLGLGLGILLAAIWVAGFSPQQEPAFDAGEHLATLSPLWATTWLVFRLVGGIITVPVVEELAFRGYLMRRLVRREFDELPYRQSGWIGLLGSSLVFGVLHSQWILGIGAGVVFGLLAMARGKLEDAVIAHVVANVGLAGYALIFGHWALLG